MADVQGTQEGGAKELFQLILHRPALLIAILVGVGLVIYFLIKSGPQGASSATTPTAAYTTGSLPDYSGYQQGYDTGYQRGSYGIPSSTAPIPQAPTQTITTNVPIPSTTIPANNATNPIPASPTPVPPASPTYTASIRSNAPLFRGDTFSTKSVGANLFGATGGQPTGLAPWGSSVTLMSPTPITAGQPNKPSTFYQLSNGQYILAQDVAGVKAGN